MRSVEIEAENYLIAGESGIDGHDDGILVCSISGGKDIFDR